MITATFFKTPGGVCRGFSLTGHAGYADKGKDIVCASVSALAINTVNSIERFAKDPAVVQVDEETGLLSFSFDNEQVSGTAMLFIDSLVLGLNGIAREYKDDNYLQIIFKEV